VLARAGKPVAKLMPFARSGKRPLGTAKGKIRMSDDFD